jgi:hypothetical protein
VVLSGHRHHAGPERRVEQRRRVVQMPPPNAPVTVIFPPSIALPGPGAGSLCRSPTTFQKSKTAPAGTTVPLITVAGPSMFPPSGC